MMSEQKEEGLTLEVGTLAEQDEVDRLEKAKLAPPAPPLIQFGTN